MYKIDQSNGNIIFPDGFVLNVPYQHERYADYAAWINAGNTPEVIGEPLEVDDVGV